MTSRGFPNQFFTGFIQGGVSANTTAMFEQQAKHIAYIIAEAQNRGATTVEPSQEGQDAWVDDQFGNCRSTTRHSNSPARPAITTTRAAEARKATAPSLVTSIRPGSTRSTNCSPSGAPQGDLEGLELKQVTAAATTLSARNLSDRIGTEITADKAALLSGEHAGTIRELLGGARRAGVPQDRLHRRRTGGVHRDARHARDRDEGRAGLQRHARQDRQQAVPTTSRARCTGISTAP